MSDPSVGSEKARRLLRGYILGTLRPSVHARVERLLAESSEWREALDAEREAMAALDALPDDEPQRDLTAAVMARVAEEEGEPAVRAMWLSPAMQRVLSYGAAAAVLCIVAAVILPNFSRARESARRASVANNLKQLGIVFKMYARDNPGEVYPPLTRYDGLWMVDLERLYPEYLIDPSVLVSPSHPESRKLADRLQTLFEEDPINWEEVTRIAAKSFTYTGWAMLEDADALKISSERQKLAKADRDGELLLGAPSHYPLREGVERFFITDINNPAASTRVQSEIPVMFENLGIALQRRKRQGAHVLYMDNHVEFVGFGEAFPVTKTAAEVFRPPED